MNDYLIPANASRGKLILGYFKPIDLVIFLVGIVTTLLLFVALQEQTGNTIVLIIVLLPALTGIFLCVPVPNQHNIRVLIKAIWLYYFSDTNEYYWKGWCERYVETNEKNM